MTMNYESTPEFDRDFKKLLKRFKSLAEDLEVVKTGVIELWHVHNIDNHSVFAIPGFCNDRIWIYKIKKFTCHALKGKGSRSGIRLIYAFHKAGRKVVFIEIYYKGDQNLEDRARIRSYWTSLGF